MDGFAYIVSYIIFFLTEIGLILRNPKKQRKRVTAFFKKDNGRQRTHDSRYKSSLYLTFHHLSQNSFDQISVNPSRLMKQCGSFEC